MARRTSTLDREKTRVKLLGHLGTEDYQPQSKGELAKALGLGGNHRGAVGKLLDELEHAGEVARIRQDRYVLPAMAGLVAGVIQFHEKGFAFVVSESGGRDLYISAENTATAMHGDRVLARITDEGLEEAGRRGRRGRGRGRERGMGERPDGKLEGRVIRILIRANATVVGTLMQSRHFCYVVADEPRLVQNIVVDPRETEGGARVTVGDKVVVRLDPWESRHRAPEGVITEVLGRADAPGVDMEAIIRKLHLPTAFPEAVLQQADEVPLEVVEAELRGRVDCRKDLIFTIDPDDARDFDDAIMVERTRGGWRLHVHIADVSHYVRSGSPLDKEAFKRGNSVYLVDRVIPMLPERLSNGICSLVPGEDRLTARVVMEVNRSGEVVGARFDRAVIHSKARLTYREALAVLEGKPHSPLERALHEAWQLASLLRKRRFAAGSLELDMPEVKVWLDGEGKPLRLEKVENDISHQLIEEFMLAANEAIARAIQEHPTRGIFRIHEEPEKERLEEFRQVALSYGYKVGDLSKRPEVQKLLRQSRGKPEENVIRIGLLKSLKRACYHADPLGHYGLAKTHYTHFTSPIRRYADLVVHRITFQVIAPAHRQSAGRRDGKIRLAPVDLRECAVHISGTERAAADAEKESVKLKKLEYLEMQAGASKRERFPAGIIDIKSYGILVELPDYLLTGLIHVSELRDDFYLFDAARLRFVGRRRKREYRIGGTLEVEVARVDRIKRQVDFRPVNGTGEQ